LAQIQAGDGDGDGDARRENNNNNASNTKGNGNGAGGNAGKGQLKNANKEMREEDILRRRYYETYPIPLHSHGILYKRNEAILGSGRPVFPKQCYQCSNVKKIRKLSVIEEEKSNLLVIAEQ